MRMLIQDASTNSEVQKREIGECELLFSILYSYCFYLNKRKMSNTIINIKLNNILNVIYLRPTSPTSN